MRQLTDIGFPITDQLLVGAIRVKLPESWNTLKTVLANTGGKGQTSKHVISQILAEEHRRIRAAGGDATTYFAKSSSKAKKKQDNGKKCTHCKRKGHDVSECRTLKREQEEKASGSNAKSSDNTSSGKPSNRSSGRTSGKAPRPSSRKASNTAKVAAAESDSSSDSDGTVQVFMARATTQPIASNEQVERVYKTKAELR